VSGEVLSKGTDLFSLSEDEMRKHSLEAPFHHLSGSMNASIRSDGWDQIADTIKLHENASDGRQVERRGYTIRWIWWGYHRKGPGIIPTSTVAGCASEP
jgi:hypothetical protein